MKLKCFGFFDDMQERDAVQLLERQRSSEPRPNEQTILAYLKGGTQLLVVPGLARDLLDEKTSIVGPPNVFTDGE